MSLAIAAKVHSLIRLILMGGWVGPPHPSSLASLYHRDGLPGVCSREKRLDTYVSEYQMLPAVDLSVDVRNITAGKLVQL